MTLTQTPPWSEPPPQRTPKPWKFLGCFAVTATLLILVRCMAGVSPTAGTGNDRTRRSITTHLCAPGHAHVRIPSICLPDGAVTEMVIPFSSLTSLRNGPASAWGSHYKWYMVNDPLDKTWTSLVADPPGYDWSSATTSRSAIRMRKCLTLTPTSNGLILKIDQRNNRSMWGETPGCWIFKIYAWADGADPGWQIWMCPAPSSNQTATLSNAASKAGVTITPRNVDTLEMFHMITGMKTLDNNWLRMVQQAANSSGAGDCIACMVARPLLLVVPATLDPACAIEVLTKDNLGPKCSEWDRVYPVTESAHRKPTFSSEVAPGNFTCVNVTGNGTALGAAPRASCNITLGPFNTSKFDPTPRADIWLWCGGATLYDRIPANAHGLCAPVTLLLPVMVHAVDTTAGSPTSPLDKHSRRRRSAPETPWMDATDPTYIDSIGVPRGVPDQYKLADQVATGFENIPLISALFPITPNKNVDRINYIHYNVQRLGNWTEHSFEAVHAQLKATSLMAYQNRIALDMLLAERGGVCTMFGLHCCTFIPNNTAADGKLTKAIAGMRTLNKKMKDHSGVDTTHFDEWLNVFGKYKSLIQSILASLAIFAALLTLCGCCCIPCIRTLLQHLITTAVGPLHQQHQGQLALFIQPPNEAPGSDMDSDEDEEKVFLA